MVQQSDAQYQDLQLQDYSNHLLLHQTFPNRQRLVSVKEELVQGPRVCLNCHEPILEQEY